MVWGRDAWDDGHTRRRRELFGGAAFRFDLPWVTDKWDRDQIISILEMIDVLPSVRNSL